MILAATEDFLIPIT